MEYKGIRENTLYLYIGAAFAVFASTVLGRIFRVGNTLRFLTIVKRDATLRCDFHCRATVSKLRPRFLGQHGKDRNPLHATTADFENWQRPKKETKLGQKNLGTVAQ